MDGSHLATKWNMIWPLHGTQAATVQCLWFSYRYVLENQVLYFCSIPRSLGISLHNMMH